MIFCFYFKFLFILLAFFTNRAVWDLVLGHSVADVYRVNHGEEAGVTMVNLSKKGESWDGHVLV